MTVYLRALKCLLPALATLLLVHPGRAADPEATATKSNLPSALNASTDQFTNQEDLKAAIDQLKENDQKKYPALYKLIDYAAPELLRNSNVVIWNAHQDWHDQAAKAVEELSTDQAVLEHCLDQGPPLAKRWAVNRCFTKNTLFPRVLAAAENTDDSTLIENALFILRAPYKQKLLTELRGRQQKDPYILELIYPNEADFNERLAALLRDKDENIRAKALLLIGADGQLGLAQKLNHAFNGEVFREIVKLSNAPSAKERALAAYALTRMRLYDPPVVKEVFLRLAKDKDEDVRWRVGNGLLEQRGDAEVNQVFEELLKDPSPLVQYMTIISLPDRTKYLKQLEGLKAVQAKLMPEGAYPVNAAQLAAACPKISPPRQFLLPCREKNLETKRDISEQIHDRCQIIRQYAAALRLEGNEKQAASVESRLSASLAPLDKKNWSVRPDEKIICVVSANGEGSDSTETIYNRTVQVRNAGSHVTLMLLAGAMGGTHWHVEIANGTVLDKIILSGNGNSKTTVTGNFPKATPVIQKAAKGNFLTFWLPYGETTEAERGRLAAFLAQHKWPAADTVQLIKPEDPSDEETLPIVVGKENLHWRQSRAFQKLTALYFEAELFWYKKFGTTCDAHFPMLVGRPVKTDVYPPDSYDPGWYAHHEAKAARMPARSDGYSRKSYDFISYNPQTEEYYLTDEHQQILSVNKLGKEVLITPSNLQELLKTKYIGGLVFDTKRKRLLATGNGSAIAFDPQTRAWTKLDWKPGTINLACYNAQDDSLYARSGDTVFKLNAENGNILLSGKLPMSEEILFHQIYIEGDYLYAVSPMFAVANGMLQLVTIVDIRDGTIVAQGDCNFAPLAVSQGQ
jgi:hypothetical protein